MNVPGGLSFNADDATGAGEDSSVHARGLVDGVGGVEVAEASDTVTADGAYSRVVVQVDGEVCSVRVVFDGNVTTACAALEKIVVGEVIA